MNRAVPRSDHDKCSITHCKRCGNPFTPRPTRLKAMLMTRCCETCCVRNLFDVLDLPTPPELLDRHTKHPTLSQVEFHKNLKDDTTR